MKKSSGLVMVAVALGSVTLVSACGTEGDTGDEGVPLQTPTTEFPANASATGNTEKACTPPRNDVFGFITIGSGSWGSWQACHEYCPANSFAYTVSIQSEGSQGGGDDTAMNGVKYECYDRTTGAYKGFITSARGAWGSWQAIATTNPYVVSNPWVGGQMKIEGSQGAGDDTSANRVGMTAKNGAWVQVAAATNWGSWNATSFCAAGQAVCGVKTRVEGSQGGGDDTALNGISLACCAF